MANRDKKNRSFEANRERFRDFDEENRKKKDKAWRKAKKAKEKQEKKQQKQAENDYRHPESNDFWPGIS